MRRQITADELAAFFHGIGACIWQVQYLEDVLHTFLTLKIEVRASGKVNEREAKQLLAKHRRATLGTSLRIAEQHGALPADLIAALRGLKNERDWLVHRSMHEDSQSLYTDEGRAYVGARIRTIEECAGRLKGELMHEFEHFCINAGVSISEVDARAAMQIAALRGKS